MKRKQFTLIELLVVIAIIAILAAMLLPALGQTKKTAQSSTCKSRMKTITMANILYQGDYKEWAPFRDESFGSGSSGYFGFHCYVSPYMGNFLDQFKSSTWSVMQAQSAQVSAPFMCPVQDPAEYAQVFPNYNKKKVPLIAQLTVYQRPPNQKFQQLSKAVMITDMKKKGPAFLWAFYDFKKLISWFDPRHSKKSNTGFFDGSVRAEQYFEEKFIVFNLTKTGAGMIHNGPSESY